MISVKERFWIQEWRKYQAPRSVFDEADYDRLHSLVFREDYSGYKPNVAEIPNGDGKVDAEKRYAHVALKYMKTAQQKHDLMPFLQRAHALAETMGRAMHADKFMPEMEFGALRVLDYPPGSISNLHTDFDLFTLMCYRDQPEKFVCQETGSEHLALNDLRRFDAQSHLGEIGELIGWGKATPHQVLPSETRQKSIVYFAIPDHSEILIKAPTIYGVNTTVGQWLDERVARSRTYR